MPEKETLPSVFVNGVRLHYAVAGEGRPVLLCHGNGEDHHLFDPFSARLTAAGFRVYAPDSRGHGANEPLAEYHYADMAEDMYGFIRALGLHQPVFYGHSDGGIVGLLLETAHPGTLSLLAASGVNLSPEGLDPAFLAECEEMNRRKPDPLITLMLTEPHISPESLRQIACPVLITAGEKDLVLPGETRRIASALPRCRLVIVEGADHGSYIRDGGIMGDLLLRFLEHPPEGPSLS